ncbi:MAG: purine-nucleoside phosphorylase [candidate division KSB1 bacterium]|nr:purine-nucleoside phosphorylase [candidate division KSB1 bacterium]
MAERQGMTLKDKVRESLAFLRPLIPQTPSAAVVLGSGMGGVAEALQTPVIIDVRSIPHYPVSTVPGHAGRWIFGRLNAPVLCIQGRVHYYEGYSLAEATYYVHLVAGLGIRNLILTTACGGLNPDFRAGDLMLIADLINFAGKNPLRGRPENLLGPRFPDMSKPFDAHLCRLAEQAAAKLEIPLRRGVFCWVTGPNYETPAEVRALRRLGGDAVSMSTAPEVIVARQRHLNVLGLALITNAAAGLSAEPLTHEEVMQTAESAGQRLQKLLVEIISAIALFDKQTDK